MWRPCLPDNGLSVGEGIRSAPSLAEPSVNADLRRGQAEINSALVQADPFSPVCQVYAPIYRQVTLADLDGAPGP